MNYIASASNRISARISCMTQSKKKCILRLRTQKKKFEFSNDRVPNEKENSTNTLTKPKCKSMFKGKCIDASCDNYIDLHAIQ